MMKSNKMASGRRALGLLAATGLLAACASTDSDQTVTLTDGAAVSFAAATTAQTDATRAGSTGHYLSDADLQAKDAYNGFGVYAYHTAGNKWATGKLTTTPNFMYNQRVQYDNFDKVWTYSPVKYWPNDNQPADGIGATGAQSHSYLSFFAYAPYIAPGTVFTPDAPGICGLSANNHEGAPYVDYLWTPDPAHQVDLLWASQDDGLATMDLYKTKPTGEGYADGKVHFTFKHALACIDILVQRVYDEVTDTDGKPDNEQQTRMFVNRVTLTPASDDALREKGRFNLATGEWSVLPPQTAPTSILFSESMFSDLVGGTAKTLADENGLAYIRDRELDKWVQDGYGVIDTLRSLTPAAYPMMVIPTSAAVTFTPSISYSMIVRDDALELNSGLTDTDGHKYSRIVNTITGNDLAIGLEPGKKYTLLLSIGAEHVAFEVFSVEDWDFPMRFTPTTTGWNDGDLSKTLNED